MQPSEDGAASKRQAGATSPGVTSHQAPEDGAGSVHRCCWQSSLPSQQTCQMMPPLRRCAPLRINQESVVHRLQRVAADDVTPLQPSPCQSAATQPMQLGHCGRDCRQSLQSDM